MKLPQVNYFEMDPSNKNEPIEEVGKPLLPYPSQIYAFTPIGQHKYLILHKMNDPIERKFFYD